MNRIHPRLLGGALVALTMVLAAGCGDPASSEAADGRNTTAARNPDGPPADYVRARCSLCSCAFFGGDDAQCKRPTCKHHWSDHK